MQSIHDPESICTPSLSVLADVDPQLRHQFRIRCAPRFTLLANTSEAIACIASSDGRVKPDLLQDSIANGYTRELLFCRLSHPSIQAESVSGPPL